MADDSTSVLEPEQLGPEKLFEPIQFVPGVGPYRAPLLKRLGLERAVDLLFYFPRTYETVAQLVSAKEISENMRLSLLGTIVDIEERVTQSGRHMLGVLLDVGEGCAIRLLWFNQAFRKKDLRIGRKLVAEGTVRSTVMNWEMVQPNVVFIEDNEIPESQRPRPVYALTEGLQQAALRKIFGGGVRRLIPLVEDVLPSDLREALGVLPIAEALEWMHWPETLEQADQARRRFVVQELFVLQLAVGLQRLARQAGAQAPVCLPTAKIHSRILNRLGYILTGDQLRAISQVGSDMGQEVPMNRLLQGDVGCGKTVVAQYAMLLAVAHGYQAAMMAPTEVLARQHDESLRRSLASSRVRIGLLLGSTPRSERQQLLEATERGELDLLVGTQVLLGDTVKFRNLALVIVDEQHKFGVEQRARLRRGELEPHYLVLSATPIPRTLAMTAFGDLDVSIIREMPPGRARVRTYLGEAATLESWWRFVDDQIELGRQAYVIAPRVLESTGDDSVSAVGLAEALAAGQFAHRRVGLLHGRLDSGDKERVLSAFSTGALDVLVSTTVVEVGIDVPNATVMTIFDADRLGLSQLHQLRGRVGRGKHSGYVCAFPSAGNDAQDHERLKAFEQTADGFDLAELDLQLRGAGDMLGTRQHGASLLRVADLARDSDLVAHAREVATMLLKRDPGLGDAQLARLRKQVMSKHGEWLAISDVG
jgi:ATP-dependent DNA helicase RecG